MAQITVKDGAGDDQTVAKVTNTGSAADADSLPVAWSTEAKAQFAALIALLPASLGIKAAAASLSVAPASDSAFSAGAPRVSSATIVSLETNASGATYNAFGSQACTALDIVNTAAAAVDLEVRRGGSGSTIIVPAGSARLFVAITNASDLQVRRVDQSNTQITFTAEALA